jgi:ornithine cyclodeaminase/alanine dehydrogenase-like protein (mu-crystallin family)
MSHIEFASAPMLVLTDEQVQSLLSLPRLIEAVTHGFREEYEEYRIPVRTKFVEDNTVTLVMPCLAKGAIGIKTILLASRPGRGPRTYASSYTFHSLDGALSAFFEAKVMTELRTAATSAAATRALAPESVTTLGIYGTGAIAQVHIEALLLVRNFTRVLVCGASPEKSREFAQRMQLRHGVSVAAVDTVTCASESSVICTCTTSPEPLFAGNLLQPGTHINAVGAFTPDMRELDSDTINRSRVVVDTFGGALAEAGDLLIPLAEGRISREHVLSDLHGALTEPAAIRRSPREITVFKSVGCALEDMVAAHLLIAASQQSSATRRSVSE